MKKLLSVLICLAIILGIFTVLSSGVLAVNKDANSVGDMGYMGGSYTLEVGDTMTLYLRNYGGYGTKGANWHSNSGSVKVTSSADGSYCTVKASSYTNSAVTISCTYGREYSNGVYYAAAEEYCTIYVEKASTAAAKQCLVIFDPNGGSASYYSTTVSSGDTIGRLPTPTRTGYTFSGWYTSGGSKVTVNTTVYDNITIYARWTSNTTYDNPTYSTEPDDLTEATQPPTYYYPTTEPSSNRLTVQGIENKHYTGKPITQDIEVLDGRTLLTEGGDYTLYYRNKLKVGKATVSVICMGKYSGCLDYTFLIKKAVKKANPVKVTAKKTVTVKANKKTVIKNAVKVTKAKGKVSYKTNSRWFTVKKGTLTVAKGLTKSKYKVKVTVTAKGNEFYKSKKIVKTITVKIK